MELIILGSGTCVPSLVRGSPAAVIRSESQIILIDSGTGTLERLLKVGITIHEVDMIFYTHTHPDHVADLVPFLFASKYDCEPRHQDLVIMGGRGFSAYFRTLLDVYGDWIQPGLFSTCLKESEREVHDFGDFCVVTAPMNHRPESIAFRFETQEQKSIVLSGDTDYNTDLVQLAAHADLLVLESSFPDEKKVEGHLSPSVAGRIASEARCKKLVLTHLYPICEKFDMLGQCASTYDGPIEIAHDLAHYRF